MCIRDRLYLNDILVVCFSGRQIKCHDCHLDRNSSSYDILRWRRKSTTTILKLTSSTCERSERYVQRWKYFRFVVVILKDRFVVNSNSSYLASVSSISPKTYDYSLTLLWCEQHLQMLQVRILHSSWWIISINLLFWSLSEVGNSFRMTED